MMIFHTFYAICFNVIGIIGSTDKQCGVGNGKKGENGEADRESFYCLFSFYVHLGIFFEAFKSMNEFGLILSVETLKHYVII